MKVLFLNLIVSIVYFYGKLSVVKEGHNGSSHFYIVG